MENYELPNQETEPVISGDNVQQEPMITLEDAIVTFTSYEEIVDYVDNLQFFDHNCSMIRSEIDKITLQSPVELLVKLQQELYVVNRISTIHKHKNVFKDEYSSKWLKKIITNPNPEYRNEQDEVLGILPNGFGAHMSPEEFDMYVKAFDELYSLEEVPEEKEHFILPFDAGTTGFREYYCTERELIRVIRKDRYSGIRVTDLLIRAKKLTPKFTNKELLKLVTRQVNNAN